MKPILFNTEMVRAILEGRKTVTRRVVKPQPPNAHDILDFDEEDNSFDFLCGMIADNCFIDFAYTAKAPYRPGDILYVRETWCDPSGTGWPVLYKADMPMHWDADDTETGIVVDLKSTDYKWRPSIHMPREAARIFLRVTDLRVERVQDIDDDGVVAEGLNIGEAKRISDYAFQKRQEYIDLLAPYEGKLLSDIPASVLEKADSAMKEAQKADRKWNKIMGFSRAVGGTGL